MELVARPIDYWPGRPLRAEADRTATPFKASWSATNDLLRKEVEMIATTNVTVVLQMAITERDCRNDGWIRADSTPSHPGVIVTFKDVMGKQLRFSTDLFTNRGWSGYLSGWQSNVRAVALGLEALRKVERYGLGQGDEQYRGFAAIGSGEPMALGAQTMSPDDAARILLDAAMLKDKYPVEAVIGDGKVRDTVYRAAARRTHPDTGDDSDASHEAFQLVGNAKETLDTYAPIRGK